VLRTIGLRLLLLVPVLLLVSIGTFLLVDLVPGDPAVQLLGPNSTPEEYARIRDAMGLDEPLTERYLDWLGGALTGDLGRNLVPPVEDVTDKLSRALPVNLELAVLALLMALVVALPLGMWSAYRAGSRVDRAVSFLMAGLISVPTFLAGLLMVLALAIHWRWFPLGQWARPTEDGWGTNLHHAFLPALTLALGEMAVFTRLLRSDMISTLKEDYILAARARGMPPRHILVRDALRPSSFSLITLAGLSFGRLIGGTVVVEAVFALPGVGSVVVDGARKSDYPVVQGGVIVIAALYVTVNLLIDALYHFVDPRVRHGRR
jgi:peptide/nickel transport system permease protein